MVLADALREWSDRQRERRRQEAVAEGREEGRAVGLEEGRAQERAKWMAWYTRRLEAEASGQSFDEPPPLN